MYDCHRFAEGCPDQNYFSFESFKCKLLSISFVLKYAGLRFDNVLPHQLSEFEKYVMHIFVRFVKYIQSNDHSCLYMSLQYKILSLCLTLVLNLLVCRQKIVHKLKEKLSKMQSLL